MLGERLARYGFGDGHPFGPDRHGAFVREFQQRGLRCQVRLLEPRDALTDELQLFHTPEHVHFVMERSQAGSGWLDGGDTPAFRGVFEAAACVVGASLTATEWIIAGSAPARVRADRAGCITPRASVRPDSASSTIAAWSSSICGVTTAWPAIAYVDIDAHHGDGVYLRLRGRSRR